MFCWSSFKILTDYNEWQLKSGLSHNHNIYHSTCNDILTFVYWLLVNLMFYFVWMMVILCFQMSGCWPSQLCKCGWCENCNIFSSKYSQSGCCNGCKYFSMIVTRLCFAIKSGVCIYLVRTTSKPNVDFIAKLQDINRYCIHKTSLTNTMLTGLLVWLILKEQSLLALP